MTLGGELSVAANSLECFPSINRHVELWVFPENAVAFDITCLFQFVHLLISIHLLNIFSGQMVL